MNADAKKTLKISPSDVAKYFLYRSLEDGEPVTPLKMQKLVYYAYVWGLVNTGKKLFNEPIEAWPNGPVVPSLYNQLKPYGSAPISKGFLGFDDTAGLNTLVEVFPGDVKDTLDEVYEKYMTKTAFELVALSHSEAPWMRAREGLAATDPSNNPISDKIILSYYGEKKAK